MQLLPGTEVAVAPKRRKNNATDGGSFILYSNEKSKVKKALLRLQDSGEQLSRKYFVKGLELGVTLTSVAFVNLETANSASLQSLQLVTVVPRLSSKESRKSNERNTSRLKNKSASKEVDGPKTDGKECRQAIVRLLISDSVATGHVMIAPSLRYYLNAGRHSCMLFLPVYKP